MPVTIPIHREMEDCGSTFTTHGQPLKGTNDNMNGCRPPSAVLNAGAIAINDKTMPIAVVGMSCRLPGGSSSPEKLWDMLSEGRTGWSNGSDTRFKMRAFRHPATELSGVFYAQGIHLLEQDISQFDAPFFNISPLEAKAVDPQQRFLLEVAYEAFENAGQTLQSLSGSDTGVYIAGFSRDYDIVQGRDPENSPFYRLTGNGLAIMSNRISYCFNLKGPSFTLDTGCSGSLVALHLACQSIRTGEVKQALVGGTNLIIDPDLTASLSSLKFLSDSGRCFTFDHRASGYGRGEGVAAVVLKPLVDALRDGDPIRAVIRNTVVNQDGRTPGLTMPNQSAQETMIRQAYAGLDHGQCGYVEAHGTGTEAGDALEAGAISAVLGRGRSRERPVVVGSIKTNVGHTESTAGIAGLIKTILALEHGWIPANQNFEKASDRIPLEDWHIKVPQTLIPWPIEGLRRASVNSFGYGGTNAHVVLDDAYHYLAARGMHRHWRSSQNPPTPHPTNKELGQGRFRSQDGGSGSPEQNGTNGHEVGMSTDPAHVLRRHIIVLSGNSQKGLQATSNLLRDYVRERSETGQVQFLDDLAHTLCTRRTLLDLPTAQSVDSLAELLVWLERVGEGSVKPGKRLDCPKLCFAFTGQGAQWHAMGRELREVYPAFSKSISAAGAHFTQLGAEWELKTELSKSKKESRVNNATLSQPLCTAIQIALVDLLNTWNIQPSVVVGHSSGEIAAAYAAGALSFTDALSVAYHRGRLVETIHKRMPERQGAMMAAGLSAEQASSFIASLPLSEGTICVACINGPSSVTVSGDKAMVLRLQDKLEAERIFNRLLTVDTAYHSHHMDIIHDEYIEALDGLHPRSFANSVRMVSSVSGKEIRGEDLNPAYWGQNLVSMVRFSAALEKTCLLPSPSDISAIIEIGPHAALAGPIKQTLKGITSGAISVNYYSALVRNVDATKTTHEMVCELFIKGVDVDLRAVNSPKSSTPPIVLTDLPPHAWDHSAHWHESRLSAQYRLRERPRHDVLGVPSLDNNPLEPRWRKYLSVAETPWLRGHAVQGQMIYPASGYICMAVEAVRQQISKRDQSWENQIYRFRDFCIGRALLVPDDAEGIETIFSLRPSPCTARESSSTWDEFRVFSVSSNGIWTEHCRGLVSVQLHVKSGGVEGNRENEALENIARERLSAGQSSYNTIIEPRKLYEALTALGLEYTGAFRGLTSVRTEPLASICTFQIPETKYTMPGAFEQPNVVHPTTLDLCFQAMMPALMTAGSLNAPVVINFIEELSISSDVCSTSGTELLAHLMAAACGQSKHKANITVSNTSKQVPSWVMNATGLVYTSLGSESRQSEEISGSNLRLCHRITWSPDITLVEPQDVRNLCAVGLSDDSALDHLNAISAFGYRIIRETLPLIHPEDEVLMSFHHKKLFDWMRNSVTNDHGQPPHERNVASLGVDGELLGRIGSHLVDILKGTVDPLTLLMKDDLLYQYYANMSHRCYTQLAEYVRLLSFKKPAMKVLEIGAGTGSATVPLLEAFTKNSEHSGRPLLNQYVFTDVSTGFFEKARALLSAWDDVVEFRKLDIETSVSEQGFEEGIYDLVVASNVLHATRIMKNTVKNVRKLLKPGGKLCLIELTEPSVMTSLVFGTLEGWWSGVSDGRIDSPLLSVEKWKSLLGTTGFSGIDAWFPDYPAGQGQQLSTIISSAVEDNSLLREFPVHIIHTETDVRFASETAEQFKAIGGFGNVHQSTLAEVRPTGTICVVMLELDRPLLSLCTEAEFDSIRRMLSCAKGVLWLTKGGAVECSDPLSGLITGLARSTRSEQQNAMKLITLDLDMFQSSAKSIAEISSKLLETSFNAATNATDIDFEYAERNGKILIPRLVPDARVNEYIDSRVAKQAPQLEHFFQPGRPLSLEVGTAGLLETLHWADSVRNSRQLASDELRIETRLEAINFRDIMIAMGQLEGYFMVGECSGIVMEVGSDAKDRFQVGDRVCAVGTGSYANSAIIKMQQAHPIPDNMSLEVAASIPVSYTTAYYSLKSLANLRKDETLLIHSAAGALGQAAIMIAQHLGARIFATVGSVEKKSFIMDNFGIPQEHIFSSRLTTFSRGIRRLTGGKGVDVVLNSLAGEALRETCKCVAKFGRFIEVGKRDALMNARMDMDIFDRHVMYASVDLGMVFMEKPTLFQELLQDVVELVSTGVVGMIRPIEVMPLSDIEGAFRHIRTGKHMGKVVLKADIDTRVKVLPCLPAPAKFKEDGWYVISGGTGGLGQAIIRWMATLKAKNIIALSRSGSGAKNSRTLVEEMREAGVNLVVQKCDIGDLDQVQKVLDIVGTQRIFGIIQGAMVLRDALVSEMSHSQWQEATRPKIQGTLNLHKVLGNAVDFFVMLSSGNGIIGTYGQGNYAAGNTFQDAFARHLSSKGLPARTLDLSGIEDAGYVAEHEESVAFIKRQGLEVVKLERFLLLLNHTVTHPFSEDFSSSQTTLGLNSSVSSDSKRAIQSTSTIFSHGRTAWSDRVKGESAKDNVDMTTALKLAATPQAAVEVVCGAILDILSKLLAIPIEDLSGTHSVSYYGLDSLVAVELCNWVSMHLDAQVKTIELLNAVSIRDLATLVVSRSKLVPDYANLK